MGEPSPWIPDASFSGQTADGGDEARPVRPTLPLALGLGLSLWLAAAVLLTCGPEWDAQRWSVIGIGGVIVVVLAALLLIFGPRPLIGAVALGVALAAACCGTSGAWRASLAQQLDGYAGEAVLVALEDASAGQFGSSALMELTTPSGRTVRVTARLEPEAPEIRFGDVIDAKVTLSKPSGNSAAYAWRQGCLLSAKVTNVVKRDPEGLKGLVLRVRNRAVDCLNAVPGEGAGLVAAVTCGYRETLDEGVYQSFKAAGLAHVVAVSGAHLSIVCAFVACLLTAARASRRLAIGVQCGLVLAYLVLAAMPVSALRAAVMTVAGLGAFFAKRRANALNALALCMALFIILDPWTALSVSFALSAGSTLGIVLFSGLIGSWITVPFPHLPRFVRDALALTLASNVATLPLSAAWFSQVPVVAPLANVVTAPLFAPFCALCLAGVLAVTLVPPLTGILLGAACAGASLLAALVGALAAVPFASVPVALPFEAGLAGAALAMAALWVFWPRLSKRGLAGCGAAVAVLLIAVVVIGRVTTPDEIRMLDVGQGDALLIRSGASSLLIDTGNKDSLLYAALGRAGITTLDAVLVTHGDDDHMGSLGSLRGVVGVGKVLVARDMLTCGCDNCERTLSEAARLVGAENIVGLAQGDRLQCGIFSLEVVWPAAFTDEGGNGDSLCVLAEADVNKDGQGDWNALLVGDAEHEQLAQMLEEDLVTDVDLYKVGHHGSKNALTGELAQALSPQVALISVGASNRYGHPSAETLGRLEDAGAAIVRTDESGDVSCVFGSEGLRLTTQR